MKRLILAAGLFAATVAMSLYGQTIDLRASIPFDFRIGNTTLPPGNYVVRNSGNVMFLKQSNGGKGGYFITVKEDHPNTGAGNGTLMFSRYGEVYYLSKVWATGAAPAQKFPPTARERELASRIGLSGTTTVALRTK